MSSLRCRRADRLRNCQPTRPVAQLRALTVDAVDKTAPIRWWRILHILSPEKLLRYPIQAWSLSRPRRHTRYSHQAYRCRHGSYPWHSESDSEEQRRVKDCHVPGHCRRSSKLTKMAAGDCLTRGVVVEPLHGSSMAAASASSSHVVRKTSRDVRAESGIYERF